MGNFTMADVAKLPPRLKAIVLAQLHQPLPLSPVSPLQIPKKLRPIRPVYVTGMMLTIVGLKTESESNLRQHWRARSGRQKAHRRLMGELIRPSTLPPLPVTVKLIRIGPRTLDDDNLRGSFKAIRDEIAHLYAVDDGDQQAYRWEYDQERGDYAVRLEILSSTPQPGKPDPDRIS